MSRHSPSRPRIFKPDDHFGWRALESPLSEAMSMLGIARALLTLLITVVVPQFAGLACAKPAPDRPFFVRWADSGNNKWIAEVHFANAHAGWAVGHHAFTAAKDSVQSSIRQEGDKYEANTTAP
jgi:hypothetical protein